MHERHLASVQLLAWLDGSLRDAAAVRHASRCPICRARRKDLERSHNVGEETRDPGRHVDEKRLVAYAEGLSVKTAVAGLETHLLTCDACLDSLRILELALTLAEQPVATPQSVIARALDAFRRPSMFDAAPNLGTLWIEPDTASAKGYRLRYEPSSGADEQLIAQPTRMPEPERDSVSSPLLYDDSPAPHRPNEAFRSLSRAGKSVPGSFSLPLAGTFVAIRVAVRAGQLLIEMRLPAALSGMRIAAMNDAGEELRSRAKQGVGRQPSFIVGGRGKTRLFVSREGQVWTLDVVVLKTSTAYELSLR